MIDIGKADFFIDVPGLPRREFERYSSNLFDIWDQYIEETLKLPDYSVSLEIEEGSIKGAGKVAVVLSALYFGIGNYGDFISGLQAIRGQVSYLGTKLIENAVKPFEGEDVKTTSRNSGATLSQLHGLFQKVQSGKMSPDQAMVEAQRILGDEADSSPEFMDALENGLVRVPKNPSQISLLGESDLWIGEAPVSGDRKPRQSPAHIPVIPSDQYRIVIWRESKRKKKNVKVTKVKKK